MNEEEEEDEVEVSNILRIENTTLKLFDTKIFNEDRAKLEEWLV